MLKHMENSIKVPEYIKNKDERINTVSKAFVYSWYVLGPWHTVWFSEPCQDWSLSTESGVRALGTAGHGYNSNQTNKN